MKLIREITDLDIIGTDGRSNAKPRYTARAILRNSQNLYAVMYSEVFDFYSFPGGGIDPGEDVIHALRREVLEETGCLCSRITEIGMVKENRGQSNYTQISYYFSAVTDDKVLDPSFTKDEEINKTSVSWYPLEEAVKLITLPVYETVQRKFLQARDIAALNEYLKNR